MEFSRCSLTDVARETIEELSTIYGQRFALTTPSHSLEGRWSSDGFRRILENLCSNAVKYGSREADIVVTLRDLDDHVLLSVQNRGNLIGAEDQGHIFDLYQRADSGTKATGWGLGLALVKGLTEALEGTVAVRSNPDEGTVFTVTLPKSRAP